MRDTLNDMQQYLVDEFAEEYQEGHMTRRDALRRIAGIMGSLALAETFLASCGQPAATATPTTAATAAPAATTAAPAATTAATSAATSAATAGPTSPPPTPDPAVNVAADDPSIEARAVTFPGTDPATLVGYLAKPLGAGPFPAVLVCHENRGLTPYIEDVTRRLAKAGYVGLAVDLLSRQGGTAKVTDAASVPGLLSALPPEQLVGHFQAGLAYLETQPFAQTEQVGMVGFCYGGGVTWRVAAAIPQVKAAVPFYGPPVPVADVPRIQGAVLAMYGELDQRINASIPEIEAAMQQNKKIYEKHVYPGANHAFHNDTGRNYNAAAAKDAWARTLAWFQKYLKT